MTDIPETVRTGLPDTLSDAQIVGPDVDKSLRLWGPPGTGKTTQLSLRLATRLETGMSPRDATVVTYRRELADAIIDNLTSWGVIDIDDDAPHPSSPSADNPYRFWSTVHAGAARATGFFDSIDDNPETLEGMVDSGVPHAFCGQMGIGDPYPDKPWEDTKWTVFRDTYTFCKNNLLRVGDYDHLDGDKLDPIDASPRALSRLDDFTELWDADFADVVDSWEAFKADKNVYDFYQILERAAAGPLPPTEYVVIDEYHDATPLMALVAERWVDAAETAIVAGDPDQVVNGYAGASPDFFERLGDRVEASLPITKLSTSYRCADEHLAAASKILSEHREPPSVTTAGPGLIYRHRLNPEERYRYSGDDWTYPVASDAAPPSLVTDSPGSTMFLSRTQRLASGVTAALDAAGIVYRTQEGITGGWGDRLTLAAAIETLEGVRPVTGGGLDKFSDSNSNSDSNTVPLRDTSRALSADEATLLLQATPAEMLDIKKTEIKSTIEDRKQGPTDNPTVPVKRLADVVTDTFWTSLARGLDRAVENMVGLSDRDKMALSAATDRYESLSTVDPADVRVLTIHASKGSEADRVVVLDGITGTIRSEIAESPRAAENESRTWYVALTRAREELHIIRDATTHMWSYLPDGLEPSAAQTARQMRN